MKTVVTTDVFDVWFEGLRDKQGKRRIQARIDCAEEGNFGDHKSVGQGVSETRIDCGPGYQLYFILRELELVILLAGGDKSSQQADIRLALAIARELED